MCGATVHSKQTMFLSLFFPKNSHSGNIVGCDQEL